MQKILLVITVCLLVSVSYTQVGSWNVINVKGNINERWSLFGEWQLRSLSFYNQFHYYEYKGGATYNINNNFSIQAGLGNYDTYAEGGNFKTPMVNDEFRTWIQLAMKNNLNPFKFEHRYRAEQRWTVNGYRNRFRYRLQAITPLNKNKLEMGALYTAVWNEIFFTNNAPYFERNRFFIGLGYELRKNLALQTGYLNQFDYRINDETGRNFLQISLLYEFAIHKKKQEHVTGTIN